MTEHLGVISSSSMIFILVKLNGVHKSIEKNL